MGCPGPALGEPKGGFQPCDTVAQALVPGTGQNDPKPQPLVFAAAAQGIQTQVISPMGKAFLAFPQLSLGPEHSWEC